MGTQMELVAKRRDGSEVMVEIALSPLQNHGLPLVVAAIRDIAAYPRMKQALQRARYSEHLAQVGRLAVDARDAQVLLQHVPEIAAQALEVDLAVVFLLEPNGLEFRVRGGTGLLPGEGIGALVPNQRDDIARLCRRAGPPGRHRRLPDRTALRRSAELPGRGPAQRADGADLRPRTRDRRAGGAQPDEPPLRRRRASLSRIARQPAVEQPAARAVGRGSRPCPAARERRPADRRHRARLQQPADGDPGQSAGSRGAAGARRRRPWPAARRRGDAGVAARCRADRQAARVLATPGAAAAVRSMRARC